jgi:hypothetical protein
VPFPAPRRLRAIAVAGARVGLLSWRRPVRLTLIRRLPRVRLLWVRRLPLVGRLSLVLAGARLAVLRLALWVRLLAIRLLPVWLLRRILRLTLRLPRIPRRLIAHDALPSAATPPRSLAQYTRQRQKSVCNVYQLTYPRDRAVSGVNLCRTSRTLKRPVEFLLEYRFPSSSAIAVGEFACGLSVSRLAGRRSSPILPVSGVLRLDSYLSLVIRNNAPSSPTCDQLGGMTVIVSWAWGAAA